MICEGDRCTIEEQSKRERNMRYKLHEMDIAVFDVNDSLVRVLSGDEDDSGGSSGSSAWSIDPNRSDT